MKFYCCIVHSHKIFLPVSKQIRFGTCGSQVHDTISSVAECSGYIITVSRLSHSLFCFIRAAMLFDKLLAHSCHIVRLRCLQQYSVSYSTAHSPSACICLSTTAQMLISSGAYLCTDLRVMQQTHILRLPSERQMISYISASYAGHDVELRCLVAVFFIRVENSLTKSFFAADSFSGE